MYSRESWKVLWPIKNGICFIRKELQKPEKPSGAEDTICSLEEQPEAMNAKERVREREREGERERERERSKE